MVALEGITVGVRVCVPPTLSEIDAGRVTPLTAIELALTVTVQAAVLLPSSVLTVIIADPGAQAVTTPAAVTDAIAVLLLLQLTFWFVALEGLIIAVRVSVLPTKMLVDVFTDTPVTATVVPELPP